MRIAIVGSGVAGLVAASELHPNHDIVVFESDSRLGGHAHTVDVEVAGVLHAVDTGFIVYNERTYPGFASILTSLNVETQPTQMSFSVSDARSGLEYRGSSLNTLFAQRSNLLRPAHLGLLAEMSRFNRAARRLVEDEDLWADHDRLPRSCDPGSELESHPDESMASFLRRGHYSSRFVEQFLVPLGSAVWSADPTTFLDFPIRSYARFMNNHGLLTLRGTAQWRTIIGGSRAYVSALTRPFADRVRLNTRVHKVTTGEQGATTAGQKVELLTDDGPEHFDRVVLATHSDQALELLGDSSREVRSVLGSIRYQANAATLHTDETLLPRSRRAWASWNYWELPDSTRATVTYWMNELQSISSTEQILVTLNREADIDPRRVLGQFTYQHPVFDRDAMRAQRRRGEIQGQAGVYFAGAYWGYGFHEDGVQSALEVARAIDAAR